MNHRINHLASAMQELEAAHDLGEVPPHDTLDRALWRVRFTLAALYDEADDEADPGMPVRDLFTDLVHYCVVEGIILENELAGALDMASQEASEWAERAGLR